MRSEKEKGKEYFYRFYTLKILILSMNRLITLSLSLSLLSPLVAKSQTDTAIGLVEAGKYGNDHLSLATVISFDQKGEREKANAIYNWVTHNIKYDVEALRKFPEYHNDKAERALKSRKAICEGYAELYATLCRDAGLQAVTIEGYAKDWLFDNGDEMHIPRHEWNAVRINGKWELVDATWGAGNIYQKRSLLRILLDKIFLKKKMSVRSLRFRFKYDPKYFMQDPETFRLKHIPSDPLWQLTDTAMPLQIFEAGDSAVRVFNEQFSKLQQKDPRLDKIAALDEKQKLFEMADRVYAYNSRYPVIMALKNTYRAESMIDKVLTDSTVQHPDLMVKDANNDLKKSMEYIKLQKKAFPEEYNKLKKKNKTKSMEAKQQIRLIRTDDKRAVANAKKHIKTGDTRSGKARKKLAEVQRRKNGLNANKLEDITTAKVRKKEGSPELYAITDSIAAREDRIGKKKQTTAADGKDVREIIVNSVLLLDSLMKSMTAEDSMLRKEAIERLGMHDSYDDEVKKWSGFFRDQKYKVTDTLQKYYFADFDTVVVRFERLHKEHVVMLDMYRNNLRSYEQYKKWANVDMQLRTDYASAVKDYEEAIDTASGDLAVYVNYLEKNKKLFGMLNKIYKRQLTIVDYMERAEKSREALEAGSIAGKKAFDLKENEKQKRAVQSGIKQLQRAIDKMDGMKL